MIPNSTVKVRSGWNQTDPCSCHALDISMQADWRIVERGWQAHVLGEADHTFTDALTAVTTLRVCVGPTPVCSFASRCNEGSGHP